MKSIWACHDTEAAHGSMNERDRLVTPLAFQITKLGKTYGHGFSFSR
jgi:hypothetical protein